MLKYITILLVLLQVYLDYKFYKKIKHSGVNCVLRYMLLVFLITSNLLPVVAPLLTVTLMDEQNSMEVMNVINILFTLFIVFTLTRLTFYIFWLMSRRVIFRFMGILSSGFVLFILMKSIFVTRTDYTIKEVDIEFNNLPAAFDGYRIAFLSDIHVGAILDTGNELKRIIGKVKETESDIVLFGGDLINIHHSELDDNIISLLSELRSSYPTIAVLGNHDTGAYLPDSTGVKDKIDTACLEKKISSAGWVLLKDSTLYIHRGNDSIAITGINYSDILLKHKHSFGAIDDYNPDSVYNDVDTDVFNITISHLPQLWSVLSDREYSDLTLSGHVHAFQFKLELFGHVISPGQVLYKEWSGLYEDGNNRLYITDGIGTVGFLARLGAKPEITVINLHSK